MLRRLGYACLNGSVSASSSRGTVLRNATPERLRVLIAANLAGLSEILAFNQEHGIRLFRISSLVIPFGSHPVNTVPWWEEFAAELTALGTLARGAGMRLSFHPGQYTVLSSADDRITEAAIADLAYHCRFLDALGLGPEHKLVIHGGGAYGNKPAALERFVERYRALPAAIRRRLVLESDERVYSAADILRLCARTGAPMVIDTLHYAINPGEPVRGLTATLQAAWETWEPEDGPPKTHFSSQAPGLRSGAHALDADPEEFIEFLLAAPERPFDVMLETKGKEASLFRLRSALAARGITEQDATGPGLREAEAVPLSMRCDR